ncbi:hypothetical protein ABZ615_11855 [Streptomyces sp. NPDC007325]|uniref:hypothetical protein n=1 Tax=Streptomyces sp. NPDC007325 TaxID=3154588 RepID=UPI0033E29B82
MNDIDHTLRREVRQLSGLVTRIDQSIAAVSVQVDGVQAAQQDTRDSLQRLRDEFQAFAATMKLSDALQRSETRIGVLNDRLDHEFGHHKVVRRTTVGLLQAFDTGLVSEEVVRAVGDELMIQTPRYWLAPALVALAAWSSDDRELCERAVTEAFRRSPGRTSLLFALVLRRQNRQTAAVRWLRHYLRSQDPAALGREFAVILESVAQGAFGPAGRELLRTVLDTWRTTLLLDEEVGRAQLQRWWTEVDRHRGKPAAADFPELAGLSPQWPVLEEVLGAAEAHGALLATYTALTSEETGPTGRLEDLVDDILDRLVGEYDDDELPLRRELAYNEAVISHGGDTVQARAAADADAGALEERLDYLTVQTAAALSPAGIGVSRATQRLAVGSCHGWFREAHTDFTQGYRSRIPATVEAAFTFSRNFGAQAFGLPRWTGRFTDPMEDLERSLIAHWDTHARPFVAGLVPHWSGVVALPAAVLLIVLMISVPIHPVGGVVAALIVGGIWSLFLARGQRGARERQRYARNVLDSAQQESLVQLRAAGAELVDYESRFQRADAQEQAVRDMIDGLSDTGAGASPFEARVVRPADDRG